MEQWHSEIEKGMVDAIEEGKIVRVPEKYAKIEGLPILRKVDFKPREKLVQADSSESSADPRLKRKEEEERLSFDDLRKPLREDSQVKGELIDNFYWHISRRRRHLGWTRRQLAEKVGESETNIKKVENGMLPREDFVLINKLQEVLGINLRKDRKDFVRTARSFLDEKAIEKKKERKIDYEEKDESNELMSGDIEIIED